MRPADQYSQHQGRDGALGRMRGDVLLGAFNEVGDFRDEVVELTAQLLFLALFLGEFLRLASWSGTFDRSARAGPSRNGCLCALIRGLREAQTLHGSELLAKRFQLA